MSDICTKIVDGDHNPPIAQKAESEYIMISSKNVVNDSIIHLDDVRHLSRADFELSNARTQVSKGDVLFTSVASLGRTCIYDLDYPITFQRSVTVICTKIFNRYLKLFLDSPLYQNYVGENARGTAQKGFYINQISDSWVPIPPLNEQIRIVEKAQSLLDIVQIINYSKEETSNNIIALKSKILDLAISGKLVRQDKSNEPAIELLKRINPQYQPTDNRHYENVRYPDSWEVVKMGEMVRIISGVAYSKSDVTVSGIKVIRGGNIQAGEIIECDDDVYIDNRYADPTNNIYKGDIVLVASTGSQQLIGKTGFATRDYVQTQIGAFLRILRPKDIRCADFLNLFFQSDYYRQYIRSLAKGTNINNVKNSYIEDFVIGLPPLQEQNRIVAITNKIFYMIDEILAGL